MRFHHYEKDSFAQINLIRLHLHRFNREIWLNIVDLDENKENRFVNIESFDL